MSQPASLKIIFAEAQQWEHQFIEPHLEGTTLQAEFSPALAEELLDQVKASVDVVSCGIWSNINAAFLEQCPRLESIAVRATGYDNIDIAACQQRGIAVCNVPHYADVTVAECTFALILTLSRHIHQALDYVRGANISVPDLFGFDLYGKTLGVIGTGQIGRHVIRIGRGLGMDVLATTPHPDPALAGELQFEYTDLDSLLKQADVVSIHARLASNSYHLLDAEKLALMKPTALLINTARGGIVDSKALLDALDEGRIAGAALDVLEAEGVPRRERMHTSEEQVSPQQLCQAVEAYQLMHHPRVIVTPHIGSYSLEAVHRIEQTNIENILALAEGNPQNVVPLAKHYRSKVTENYETDGNR